MAAERAVPVEHEPVVKLSQSLSPPSAPHTAAACGFDAAFYFLYGDSDFLSYLTGSVAEHKLAHCPQACDTLTLLFLFVVRTLRQRGAFDKSITASSVAVASAFARALSLLPSEGKDDRVGSSGLPEKTMNTLLSEHLGVTVRTV